jgi:hypothetical protein
MSSRLRAGAILLAAAAAGACADPESPSEENFARVIAADLSTREQCTTFQYAGRRETGFSTVFPLVDTIITRYASSARWQPYREYLAGMSSAGLVRVTEKPANHILGPGTELRVEVTEKGRSVFQPVVDTIFPQADPTERTTQRLCFGTPELVKVTNYTEPGTGIGGATETAVEYTYRAKSAEWLVPELAKVDRTADRVLKAAQAPRPAQARLVLKANGWKVVANSIQ